YNYKGEIQTTTTSSMFLNCAAIKTLDLTSFDTRYVTYMRSMFEGCSALISVNVTSFNTSKVTNMSAMFLNCKALKEIDLSSFTLESMSGRMCFSSGSIWERDGKGMFSNCSSLEKIYTSSTWYASKFTEDDAYDNVMFDGCTKLLALNTTTAFEDRYKEEIYFARIGTFTFEGVSVKGYLNYKDKLLLQDVTSYTTLPESVTNITFDTTANKSSIVNDNTYTKKTLTHASASTQVYLYLSADKTTAYYLSTGSAIYLPIDCRYMFANRTNLTKITFGSINTTATTNMSYMFYNCPNLTEIVGLNKFNTAKVTTFQYMFAYCKNITTLNVSSFNTANVTNMSLMFYNCRKLQTITGLNKFNTSKVTTMYTMFGVCNALTSVDLSSFNTAAVTNFSQMFHSCYALTTLDLSTFNTSAATTTVRMFYNCNKLTTIYVGTSWNISGLTSDNSVNMFYQCAKLVGGNGTAFDSTKVDKTYAVIDKSAQKGYLTSK
ncbi:MAG: BspA family leucine-rich repeat surface protein, partial [Clostridia bacterium]|nr:BspA family leucine-rich repeat surface protein [Clostridia bacterium]